MSIKLRGYASVFNQFGWTSSGYEIVLPGAFKDMLANKLPVRLQFDTHADDAIVVADTGSGTLRLFEDDYGLAFEADLDEVDSATWLVTHEVVLGKHVGASVNFTELRSYVARFKGETTTHVERARIDHITITDSPAYKATHVWRADRSVEYAGWRTRDLNDRWELGRDIRLADDGDRYPHVPQEIAAHRQRALAAFKMSADDMKEVARQKRMLLAMFGGTDPVTAVDYEAQRTPRFTKAPKASRKPSRMRVITEVFKAQSEQIRTLKARIAELERRFRDAA